MLIAAFVLRCVWVFAIPTRPVDDCKNYYDGAVSIVRGEGYVRYGTPSARRPVGYSALLAALFRATGPGSLGPRLLNVVLSTATVAVAFLLAGRMFDANTAHWTGWVWAVMPNVLAYVNCISTEVTFAFLVMTSLVLVYRAGEKRFWLYVAAAGALNGYAILVRGTAFYLPLLLALVVWRRHKSVRRALGALAVFAGLGLVVTAPWVVRNYRVFGRPLLANYAGWSLYYGNNEADRGYQSTAHFAFGRVYKRLFAPESTEPTDYLPLRLEPVYREIRVPGPKQEMLRDDALKRLAVEWIKAHPFRFVKLGAIRVIRFFRPDNCGIGWSTLNTARPIPGWLVDGLKVPAYLVHPIIVLGFLMYLVRAMLRPAEWGEVRNVPLLFILYFAAISFVIVGHGRYHYPVLPLTIAYSAAAYRGLYARLRRGCVLS